MPTMQKVSCSVCGKEYEIDIKRYNQKIKNGIAFYCSDLCRSHKGSVLCNCATCGKEIWRHKSQIARSLTGNVYCSTSCANSKNNHLFKTGENHPTYNGANYRQRAFDTYEHKCVVCGWCEDERILEVHHIDENREHNEIENLCILCPICHRKITLGYYYLDGSKLIPVLDENDIII